MTAPTFDSERASRSCAARSTASFAASRRRAGGTEDLLAIRRRRRRVRARASRERRGRGAGADGRPAAEPEPRRRRGRRVRGALVPVYGLAGAARLRRRRPRRAGSPCVRRHRRRGARPSTSSRALRVPPPTCTRPRQTDVRHEARVGTAPSRDRRRAVDPRSHPDIRRHGRSDEGATNGR